MSFDLLRIIGKKRRFIDEVHNRERAEKRAGREGH